MGIQPPIRGFGVQGTTDSPPSTVRGRRVAGAPQVPSRLRRSPERREGCESGRIGTLGKRVWGNSPWVRIPLPPLRRYRCQTATSCLVATMKFDARGQHADHPELPFAAATTLRAGRVESPATGGPAHQVQTEPLPVRLIGVYVRRDVPHARSAPAAGAAGRECGAVRDPARLLLDAGGAACDVERSAHVDQRAAVGDQRLHVEPREFLRRRRSSRRHLRSQAVAGHRCHGVRPGVAGRWRRIERDGRDRHAHRSGGGRRDPVHGLDRGGDQRVLL